MCIERFVTEQGIEWWLGEYDERDNFRRIQLVRFDAKA